MAIERMFLSVTPPPDVIDLISDLPTRALRGVRFTRRKQWHITLRFLGDCQRHEALAALEALQAPAADIALGPQVALLGNRIVIVPAAGLDATAAAVDETFAGVGEATDREFVGHLTLARLKGRPLRDPSMVSVLGAPISATWHAATIDLWKSEVGDGGAEHTLVATQDLL
jgi:2'-5' RNA ligase